MNPSNSPKPIQDVRTTAENPSTNLVEAEIEHGIPVKHPEPSPASNNSNPIAAGKQFVEEGEAQNDPELDNILNDVNKKVKDVESKKESPKKLNLLNVFKLKKQKTNPEPGSKAPILVVIAAVLITVILAVVAVYAFKSNKTPVTAATQPSVAKVGTSSSSVDAVQSAGGSVISPGDLTDLVNSLQSKINALNDSQDFNANDLSDQNLGL